MTLQAEAAECGLACLAIVAAAQGQRHTLSDLRRKFSASLKGTAQKRDGHGRWLGHGGQALIRK
ncbi:cysteine peptidase family C39 domain-containing protein [Candidatus Phycosocius spiralis]|uniref:cysteine peptidase family C39 domain-containing protein n=1 Tax=Candidatus Phycosocius spiralis TaxID=2815099 RepID=UPI0024E0A571|nr:cysteine peptidase family C39 domain-containing protein [Candidatus Phycosocius spiralis]